MDQADRERPSAPGHEPTHADHGLSWLFWIPLSFTIYLLAFGPAVKLAKAVPQTRPTIAALYFWLDPLTSAFPACGKVLEWYVCTVWRVK